MIPSHLNSRRAYLAGESRNAGGDRILNELGDLIGAFYVESYRAIGEFRAFRLYEDALLLDALRLDYARGKTDSDVAQMWLEAGLLMMKRVGECQP